MAEGPRPRRPEPPAHQERDVVRRIEKMEEDIRRLKNHRDQLVDAAPWDRLPPEDAVVTWWETYDPDALVPGRTGQTRIEWMNGSVQGLRTGSGAIDDYSGRWSVGVARWQYKAVNLASGAIIDRFYAKTSDVAFWGAVKAGVPGDGVNGVKLMRVYSEGIALQNGIECGDFTPMQMWSGFPAEFVVWRRVSGGTMVEPASGDDFSDYPGSLKPIRVRTNAAVTPAGAGNLDRWIEFNFFGHWSVDDEIDLSSIRYLTQAFPLTQEF